MLKDLVVIEVNTNFVPIYERKGDKVIDARELHKFLGSKTYYTTWIQKRIEEYNFIENEDYFSILQIEKREIGATTTKDYVLTFDVAKEIAMVENNDQGRKIRKYFIEIEKMWRSQDQQLIPQNYEEAIENLLKEIKSRKILQLNDPIKAPEEIKCVEVAEILGLYSINKETPHSTFIGAIIKQLDNTNNRIFRNTKVDLFNKANPNEIIYIKKTAIEEISQFINKFDLNIIPEYNFTLRTGSKKDGTLIKTNKKIYNVHEYMINDKSWLVIKK